MDIEDIICTILAIIKICAIVCIVIPIVVFLVGIVFVSWRVHWLLGMFITGLVGFLITVIFDEI